MREQDELVRVEHLGAVAHCHENNNDAFILPARGFEPTTIWTQADTSNLLTYTVRSNLRKIFLSVYLDTLYE